MNSTEVVKARVIGWVILCLLTAPASLSANEPDQAIQRYIVTLHNPPVAAYQGEEILLADGLPSGERLAPTSAVALGQGKLDMGSAPVLAYLQQLRSSQEAFLLETAVLLGRTVRPAHSYLSATNGMALDLTAEEAQLLQASSLVSSIQSDIRLRLDTDAGPTWLGANKIWNGTAGFGASRGEGVVVGVIDSGINWEHPSFADPSGGFSYQNPYGSQLGLCSKPEVVCNNKLVGVYDFVQDNPSTEEVEENNDGRDNDSVGHGTHVASTAAGNTLGVTVNGTVQTTLSGVAPRANLVTYRVCYKGDENDPDGGGCMQSAILSAIDQAVTDGVDVLNYSIGTDAFSPWAPGTIPMAFLNARNSGIFVVTSAGNDGPNAGTVGSPANAPWVIAAGNATHDRVFGRFVQNMTGGATAPPPDLLGATLTNGLGVRKIVHAKDYGNALCGVGEAELQGSCAANQGLSNPWNGQQPFNGEIVVCDRGTYGRVEKSKNVMLAGAGGFILANTDDQGEDIVADQHCLPGLHLGDSNGDLLRTWLDSGTNHQGSISEFTRATDPTYADIVSRSSSRGPVLSPVQDLLKPNMIAPGSSILAASQEGSGFRSLSGTSMASPHIAGAAALVLALHPSWSVAQVATALETTSTPSLARDFDGSQATPHERGGGRPRIDQAVNAGLYLNVTGPEFSAANPATGGNPRNLNLSGMVHSSCKGKCSFTRNVTDQKGGGSWNATASGFPAGTVVTVNPSNFTLANGASRSLFIEVDVSKADQIGKWVYGDIVLSSAGSPDQVLTTAVFSTGGTLPAGWIINDDRDTGAEAFTLSGLVEIPDLTIQSGGFVAPTRTQQTLIQDPTTSDPVTEKGQWNRVQNEDPYDGGEGVFTVWHDLPDGGLWLHAETLASTAEDLDLFVGRDDDGNGFADEDEELCSSTSPDEIEECNLYNLAPGNYWIVVQNWSGTNPAGDVATLLSAAIPASDHSPLMATGQGIVPSNNLFALRLNWRDVAALPGEQWLGAVGLGTNRNNANNLGIIPVRFNRSGIVAPQTFPLFNGSTQSLALASNSSHERIFVDVPPGTTSLVVEAQGGSGTQSNNLKMDLFRQDFAQATSAQPFASLPNGLTAVASASGGSNQGPKITLGNNPAPGRYFVRMQNVAANPASLHMTALIEGGKAGLTPFKGLWRFQRNNYQGGEYNSIGAFDYVLWYSYDDAGQPTFFNSSAPGATSNVWVTDVLRYTNDGSQQQAQVVGKLSMTFYENNKVIYSYIAMGKAGSDLWVPLSPNTCPTQGGSKKTYHGTWGKQQIGLGGATVNVYDQSQSHIHYLFDGQGNPRFLLASDATDNMPTATTMPILHFQAYCATCAEQEVIVTEVGTYTRNFSNESTGSWTLDYQAFSPVQSVNRTDQIVKISDNLQCQ